MTDGGHFVLEPHERFVDISVLTTRETELRGTGGAVGKVNCLIFTTSLGRVFNIHFGEEVGTETILRYQATPYEDLVSFKPFDSPPPIQMLTDIAQATITWAFNSSVDDIQFNLTPSPALGRGNFLLLTDANQRIRHPWLLQDETRLFYKYGDAMPRSPAVRDVGAMRRDAAARRYTGTCEMFFWEEKDRVDSGKTLRLQRIEVMHKKGVVDGFLFEYEGGLARSFGWQNIEKSVVDLTTHKDERLSTLVVFHHTEHRSGLEVCLVASHSIVWRSMLTPVSADSHYKGPSLPCLPRDRVDNAGCRICHGTRSQGADSDHAQRDAPTDHPVPDSGAESIR